MEPLPIDLDDDEYKALVEAAKRQRRSPKEQAAVYVVKGLGLWEEESTPITATTSTNSRKRAPRAKPSGTRQEVQG